MENSSPKFKSLLKYILTVSVAVAVLLFATFSLYNIFEKAILHEMTRMNDSMTNQLDFIATNVQNFVRDYGRQIYFSPGVTALREREDLSEADSKEALDELFAFSDSAYFIDSIHIYSQSKEKIYSSKAPGRIFNEKNFYDKGAVRIFEELQSEDRLRPIKRSCRKSPDNKTMEMYYSFLLFEPIGAKNQDKGILMLNINTDWFNEMLLSNTLEKTTLITDHNANVIATRKDNPYLELSSFWRYIREKTDSGNDSGSIIYKDRNNQSMICLFSKMPQNNWLYIQTLPYDDCMQGIINLRNNAFKIFFCFIALLLIGILYSLYRIYFPFRRMVMAASKIKNQGDSGESYSTPELLDAFVEDSIKMKPRFLRATRELALISLLNSPEPSDAQVLSLQENQPVILIMAFTDKTALLTQTAEESYKDVTGVFNDGVTVLLFLENDFTAVEKSCQAWAEKFQCKIIYSDMLFDYSKIWKNYDKMLKLRRLEIFFPMQNIIPLSSFMLKSAHSLPDEKTYSLLFSKLSNGELSDAIKAYENIIENISGCCYQDVVYAFNSLNKTCEKIILQKDFSSPLEIPKIKSADEILSCFHDIGQVNSYYIDLFRTLSSFGTENRQKKSDTFIESVRETVLQNFCDYSFSINDIAQSMGLSPAYLSRQFKSLSGCSLSEYINKVRIEKACEILENESISIDDAAKRAGFANTKYFYVLFKNETGKTPKQYRSEKQQNIT